MKAADVSDWVATAPFPALLAALAAGLERRRDTPKEHEEFMPCVVGLAVGWDEGDGWEISMAAAPDRAVYDGQLPDDGWGQHGECPLCGLELAGPAKHALCPFCGEHVYMT